MARTGLRAAHSVPTMILRALLPTIAVAVLVAAPAQAAPVSVTFDTVGESVFTVPVNVRSLDVSLTGARGGSRTGWAPGGRGATISGTLAVAPGQVLYALVGGRGTDVGPAAMSWDLQPGGFNGGGWGSAGGGGATDLRTESGSLASRLAVAGGGGGTGWNMDGARPAGGDAGAAGADPSGGDAGGKPGTQTAGGPAGTLSPGGADGTGGALGQGGHVKGANFPGGGGGGGYYGGGSGAGMQPCAQCNRNGGGGGGSSLVPAGWTSGLAALIDPARVTIAYDAPAAAVSATRLELAATQPGGVSPSRTVEIANPTRTTDLTLSPISLTGDDFLVGASTCGGTLAPGESCRIPARYAPSAHGRHDAKLRLVTNAGAVVIDLTGESVAPVAAAPAPVVATPAAPVVTTRLRCTAKRCTVSFADAPKVTKNGTRVRATLTQGGRVYATADVKARRGTLRLVLKNRRAVKPGTYTLKLQIGAKRTTRTAVA